MQKIEYVFEQEGGMRQVGVRGMYI